jgi:hypothetical protein
VIQWAPFWYYERQAVGVNHDHHGRHGMPAAASATARTAFLNPVTQFSEPENARPLPR